MPAQVDKELRLKNNPFLTIGEHVKAIANARFMQSIRIQTTLVTRAGSRFRRVKIVNESRNMSGTRPVGWSGPYLVGNRRLLTVYLT